MAKTTAPLLSFEARGQIARTAVYASWRGVKYARRHTIPENPRTIAQQRNRDIFATLREMYKLLPAIIRAPWEAYSTGRQFTAMNAYVGENRLAIGTGDDFSQYLASPGARGGLPADDVTADGGPDTGSITVTVTTPPPPDDWVLGRVVAVAFSQQPANSRFNQQFRAAEQDAPSTTVELTGLPPGELCVVSGFPVWLRSDGREAFGPSLVTTATATA